MTQQLTAMDITRVSLVDKGANKRTFAVLKQDTGEQPAQPPAMPPVASPPTQPSVLDRITKAIAGVLERDREVGKAQTFGSIIAGQQLQDALYDAWYTLQDALWNAIWAYDENGVELSLEEKTTLVALNLDEFKAWLLAQMETGIAKSDRPTAEDVAGASVTAAVRKVGKKISAARLTRLQEAADALTSVLAEVQSETDTETEKRADAQEESDMTSEELVAAITKAQEPVMERLDALEKRLPAEDAEQKDEGKAVAKTADDPDAEAPAWAVALIDRVEKLEGTAGRGQRTSANGDDTNVQKSGSSWAQGIL